jgi:hypothetical protein
MPSQQPSSEIARVQGFEEGDSKAKVTARRVVLGNTTFPSLQNTPGFIAPVTNGGLRFVYLASKDTIEPAECPSTL